MRQIDCPYCGSTHTFQMPETAWIRFCGDCGEDWDIRELAEIQNEDGLY